MKIKVIGSTDTDDVAEVALELTPENEEDKKVFEVLRKLQLFRGHHYYGSFAPGGSNPQWRAISLSRRKRGDQGYFS